MKVRKPINIPQMELVSHMMNFITEHNEGLQLEFDMYMMQPCIDAANDIIKTLKNWGDFPFSCDCENEHDEECFLHGVESYDITERHAVEWEKLQSIISGLVVPSSFKRLKVLMDCEYNVFKGLLMVAIERGLIARNEDEEFYKVVDKE